MDFYSSALVGLANYYSELAGFFQVKICQAGRQAGRQAEREGDPAVVIAAATRPR